MPATIGMALASAAFAIGAPLSVVNALAGVGAIGLATQVGIGIAVIGLSVLAQSLFRAPSPKPQDQQINIRSSVAPRFRMYGRGKVGGVLLHAVASGGFFDRIFGEGQGEIDGFEEHWLDDNLLTLDGSGFATNANYIYNGRSRVQILTRPGTDSQTAFSAPGWTADHQVKGVALAHVRLEQMDIERFVTMFPNGAHTQYRTVYRGAKVRTISGGGFGSASWSDNAARVIADYLTHDDGLGLADSWIEANGAEWSNQGGICSEQIDLKAGGTESRYRIWGTYRYDERPADVLARYLAACDGRLLPTPNQGIALKVGKWEAPTVTVDDDAIISFEGVGRGRDILTTANTIRAQFTSSDHDYQATDADPWTDDDDIAERGEFVRDIEFFPSPSHGQTRRLMKLEAHRANPNWVGTLACNLRALPVLGERFIIVQLAELGIDETFEITSDPQFLIDPATSRLRGVAFDVASLSSAAFDWDAATEEGESPAIPGAFPNNSAELSLLFGAMDVHPDSDRIGLYDKLITDLKMAGVWEKMDVLHIFATHDEQAARINIKNTGFVASAVNGPTFTTDRGFTGNNVDQWINTNFNLSAHGSIIGQNSMCVGVWSRTNSSDNIRDIGLSTSITTFISCRLASGSMSGRVNDEASAGIAVPDSTGLFAANRSGASARQFYRNGASIGTDSISSTVGLPNEVLAVLRGGSVFSDREIAAAVLASSLNATEQEALYDALNHWMTEVGAA